MVDFKTGLMTAIVLLHMIQALAQNGPIVLDGAFDDWITIQGLEDSVTEGSPAVDLVEMKVTSDADHLYVYVRLASDLDLTDVLYPHNLFLQIDVDMDASTGYPVREGFGSELGIDFNSLFAYTNFGPADQVNFSEIGFIPSPTVTSKEFEFALRRDVVLEGEMHSFLKTPFVFYSETPNSTTTCLMWGKRSFTISTMPTRSFSTPSPWPKAIPRICVSVRTMCSATVSFIQFANRASNESSPP